MDLPVETQIATMDSEEEDRDMTYFPSDVEETEHLESYEPGGFHPVHLGDVYDGQYRVVHKLYFGGFSTVWLARDDIARRWVALKIVVASASPTYEARCAVIPGHPAIAGSPLFASVERRFWIDGPNGRHICLVYPVFGPDLSRLSKGIYTRLKPRFARSVSLQITRALVQLHSHGLCHGDFTASNVVLRLFDGFDSLEEDDIYRLFGRPRTAPLMTYSGNPPAPHGPDYIVDSIDFRSSTTKVLSDEICVIDFDQAFTTTGPAPEHPGIPAKYMAPEVAVGQPSSPASDVWALGCAIFRIRSGDDLFFDFDTDCPADALLQIAKTLGELPRQWMQTKFDKYGSPVVDGAQGEPSLYDVEQSRPLDIRVREIMEEPPALAINKRGEAMEQAVPISDERLAELRWVNPRDEILMVPLPAVLNSMLWKPTAVNVDGTHLLGYWEGMEELVDAFPKISEPEASLLIDLLSKIFVYDPAKRPTAEAVALHPWFHMDEESS